jgi:LytTr DNA-binding domain
MFGILLSVYGRRMMNPFIKCLSMLLAVWISGLASAEANTLIDQSNVIVCPARSANVTPPDFTAPDCFTTGASEIDPQQRLIWVKANIVLREIKGPLGQPLSLYVSGKMASALYLNGQFVGRNGKPGLDVASETPGLMDAQLYPPQSLFRVGNNEIVFLASSHHGYLQLSNPVHAIGIGVPTDVNDTFLRHYWPSLLTLGVFVLGGLYFGIAAFMGAERARALTLGIICAFAAAQLAAEVYRGLSAYVYPVHDLRLILITVFSTGFGLSVVIHVLNAFTSRHSWAIIIGAALLSLIGVNFTVGLDRKAEMAMLLPLVVSLAATAYWSYQRRPRAFVYFLSLLLFIAAIRMFPSQFLDILFFNLVAAFLLFLFVEQALAMAKEAERRHIEEVRANRLELALEQAQQKEVASTIIVKSAGRMEYITTDKLCYCRGADGYSEIKLIDNREVLHAATLSEMEETLPSTFLRVHRSYLVNTAFVKSLTRDVAGTGVLTLTNGSEIPVSRRTMPHVRQALG